MKLLFIAILGLSLHAFAKESSSPQLLGHNLSSTSAIVEKGKCTAGFLYAGCGYDKKTSFAISPWLTFDYKLLSLGFRRLIEVKKREVYSIQGSYFKNYEDRDYRKGQYEMEALWINSVYSITYNPRFVVHYNLGTNYYFDETFPFSLRRPYMDPNPLQVNLSSLLEMNMHKSFFMFGEFGLLDILNDPLHIHSGFSAGTKWKNGYAAAGFSFTSTLYAMFKPSLRRDYQQEIRETPQAYDAPRSPHRVRYDYSIHPEINIQLFF